RDGTQWAASLTAFSGAVRWATSSAASSGWPPFSKATNADWPTVGCAPVGPAGEGTTPHSNGASFSSATLLRYAMLVAALPSNMFGVWPGVVAGPAVYIISCSRLIAAIISSLSAVQVSAASFQGEASNAYMSGNSSSTLSNGGAYPGTPFAAATVAAAAW